MSADPTAAMPLVDLPGGWTVGQFPALASMDAFRHAASMRMGPGGGSLRHDDPGGVARRDDLAAALGADRCVCVRQVHGSMVVTAAEAMAGSPPADAIITDQRGLALLGLSGDCPILLAADPVAGAAGMAHASWRSTAQKLSARLVDTMRDVYGCDPANIHVGICPSAGPCCYEVGPDVIAAVEAAMGADGAACIIEREGRTYFDLWAANVRQLTAAGVARQNIEVAGLCTICDNRFFSYRREGTKAGRHGGMIAKV